MFSFVVTYVFYEPVPLAQEATAIFGRPLRINQQQTILHWPGITCDVYRNEVLWSARDPDKELWLRMNLPGNAHILDNT